MVDKADRPPEAEATLLSHCCSRRNKRRHTLAKRDQAFSSAPNVLKSDILHLQAKMLYQRSTLKTSRWLYNQKHTPGLPLMCSGAQSCPTLCDPTDSSPPGSSVHGILQARVLEWVAISSSTPLRIPAENTRKARNSTPCPTPRARPCGRHPAQRGLGWGRCAAADRPCAFTHAWGRPVLAF